MDKFSDEIAIKQVKLDKINKYQIMATMVPGLENVAEDQIREILPDCIIKNSQRGKIFFNVNSSLRQLLKIKCLDNLYYFLSQFIIGATKESLYQIKKELMKIAYTSIISSFCDSNQIYRIHVTASRVGKHSFSRFHVAAVALEALTSLKIFIKGDADNHDLHFRLDVVDDIIYFSLKLTSAVYRYRSKYKLFMPGAIRPSIAKSLIWFSHPSNKDVFLDPFCGSGTIVAERERYAYRKILAFDIQASAVETTKSNVSKKVIVREGDACHLPINDSCIHVIVTNLPWDIQIRSENIRNLYYMFLCEALRVLKENGRMILLTDKIDILRQVCQELNVGIKELAQISLHGLHPYVFSINMY